MPPPPHHQLDLYAPYKALCADYRVVELTCADQRRCATMVVLAPADWKELSQHYDYASAVAAARDHCVSTGTTVWVYDRNDGDMIVFRVSPGEYTNGRLSRLA